MLDWNKKEAPVLGLLGSGGGLGYLAGGASGYPDDTFWISEAAKGSWDDEYIEDIAGDNEGNIYVTSVRYNGGGNGYKSNSIVKHAADGTVSWQKVAYKTTSPYPMEPGNIIAEADGDYIYTSGQSDSGAFVTKTNKSDGSMVWRRQMGASNPNNLPQGLAIGSDGNLIFIMRLNEDSNKQSYININVSNGATIWKSSVKKTSGNSTDGAPYQHPKVDSSGNIHTVLKGDTGYPNIKNAIVKHNSSGTLQTITDFNSASPAEDIFADIAVDSSGNKYTSYRYYTGAGTPYRCGVSKVNSSDVVQWNTGIDPNFSNPDNYLSPEQIEVMPEDAGIIMRIDDRQNQGIAGSNPGGNSKNSFIRLDTSGNVVWKRQFGISGINVFGSAGKMRLNRNGNIIFCTRFAVSGNVYTVVAQLPADGSLTGNHTVGSRTYNWSDRNFGSMGSQLALVKQGSSIFSSELGNDVANAAYNTNVTVANNVQTFTKGDVD
jgi:hypothetical protein